MTWTAERIEQELATPLMLRRDTCDETILRLVNNHRSALLALKDALAEVERLKAELGGCYGKSAQEIRDWYAARDARMKALGAAEEIERIAADFRRLEEQLKTNEYHNAALDLEALAAAKRKEAGE